MCFNKQTPVTGWVAGAWKLAAPSQPGALQVIALAVLTWGGPRFLWVH